MLIHANTLQIDNCGLLIIGGSGSGKSAISLELIDRAHFRNKPAALISDDFSEINDVNQEMIATAPEKLKGLIEIRGAGIFHIDCNESAVLSHAVTLGGPSVRSPAEWFYDFKKLRIPLLQLPAIEEADCITICHAIEAFLFRKPFR